MWAGMLGVSLWQVSRPMQAEAPHSILVLRISIMLLVALEFLQNGMLAFGAEHIIQGLHSTPQAFSLAAAMYASVAILVIVKHRWLAERLGYRDFVLGSLCLYMLGALGAGFAGNMTFFTLARVIQALGGASLFTASRMQVNRFSGPEKLRTLRMFVMGIFSGAVLAPVLASIVLSQWNWRWLFWLMLIPAALSMLLSVRVLTRNPVLSRVRSHAHIGGLVVLAAGIFLLQFILERLPYDIFGDARYLAWLGGVGGMGIVGFVVHEWHRPTPLLAYRHFVNWRYATGIAVFFFCYLVASSNGYILPILLGRGLGMTMQQMGWWLALPFLVCMGTLNPVISLAGRYPGARKFLQFSLLMLLCYALGMAFLSPPVPAWSLALLLVVFGISSTCGMESAAQTALMGIDADVFSDAYQTKNIVREIAIACGISLATLCTHAGQRLSWPGTRRGLTDYQGYFLLLAICVVVLFIAVTLDGWVRRRWLRNDGLETPCPS